MVNEREDVLKRFFDRFGRLEAVYARRLYSHIKRGNPSMQSDSRRSSVHLSGGA